MKVITLIISFLWLSLLLGQSKSDTSQLVDYHVHIFSPELIENLSVRGFDFNKSGFKVIKEKEAYSNISEISKDNGYSKMVLVSVGYAYENLGGTLSEQEFVKKENDLLAGLVKTVPSRLIGFYGIDPLKDFAIEEIKRCDEKLKLDGIKLHLQSNNLNLKDSIQLSKLKEVLDLADKRNIPLLIHNNAWDKNSGTEYFDIFKQEILTKYDSLTIIFAHAGGGGGFYQFGYDFLKSFADYFQKNRESKRHKIYFELSTVIQLIKYPGSKTNKEFLEIMNEIGYNRFLFGSDYPVRDTLTYFEEITGLLDIEYDDLKERVHFIFSRFHDFV